MGLVLCLILLAVGFACVGFLFLWNQTINHHNKFLSDVIKSLEENKKESTINMVDSNSPKT